MAVCVHHLRAVPVGRPPAAVILVSFDHVEDEPAAFHLGVAVRLRGRARHLLQKVDPDQMDREVHAEDEAILRKAVTRYFPLASGRLLDRMTCMYTNTPDGHFMIGVLPDHPQVSVAAGFSGHGFKFASVVGEIMADLAQNGETDHDISLFRLDRFND